jgi:hypothetical protein
MNDTFKWIRSNLAMIMALCALLVSGGTYWAQMSVLKHQTDLNTIAIRELTTVVASHSANVDAHTNPSLRKDILDRLTRIESLLMTHMENSRKEPQP